MAKSELYVGHVTHHRMVPKRHDLRHRVYWMLLDLGELEAIGQRLRLFSYNRFNLTSLHDRDHGDGSERPLLEQMAELLGSAGIEAADLSIRLLVMPRVAGYDFNPLSVFFCVDAGERLRAVVYEVNNTFGGRHRYVIPARASSTDALEQSCDKQFYVSPFMDMDMTYRFRTGTPDDAVALAVQVERQGETIIHTALKGHRRDLSDRNILALAVTHPLLPVKVVAAIHWHAAAMWWRGFAVNPQKPSTQITQSIIWPKQ